MLLCLLADSEWLLKSSPTIFSILFLHFKGSVYVCSGGSSITQCRSRLMISLRSSLQWSDRLLDCKHASPTHHAVCANPFLPWFVQQDSIPLLSVCLCLLLRKFLWLRKSYFVMILLGDLSQRPIPVEQKAQTSYCHSGYATITLNSMKNICTCMSHMWRHCVGTQTFVKTLYSLPPYIE